MHNKYSYTMCLQQYCGIYLKKEQTKKKKKLQQQKRKIVLNKTEIFATEFCKQCNSNSNSNSTNALQLRAIFFKKKHTMLQVLYSLTYTYTSVPEISNEYSKNYGMNLYSHSKEFEVLCIILILNNTYDVIEFDAP